MKLTPAYIRRRLRGYELSATDQHRTAHVSTIYKLKRLYADACHSVQIRLKYQTDQVSLGEATVWLSVTEARYGESDETYYAQDAINDGHSVRIEMEVDDGLASILEEQ